MMRKRINQEKKVVGFGRGKVLDCLKKDEVLEQYNTEIDHETKL